MALSTIDRTATSAATRHVYSVGEVTRDNIKSAETIQRAAAFLNVNPRALMRMCADGKVPASKVGRNWRISGAYICNVLGL